MPLTTGQLWVYILLGLWFRFSCGGWLGILVGDVISEAGQKNSYHHLNPAQMVLAACSVTSVMLSALVFLVYAAMMGLGQ